MVLRLDAQVLEDGVRPKSLHVVPVLNLTVADRVMESVAYIPGELKSARPQRCVD